MTSRSPLEVVSHRKDLTFSALLNFAFSVDFLDQRFFILTDIFFK